ncbi:MAG: DNA-processing protein DprA, partial [Desulfobulbaceae bacterium]|nr:DNA-processing protein DprA [Desulfobulbaceae bacterium]
MSNDQRTIDWLRLSLTSGLGAAGCRRLVDHFGSPGRVLSAPRAELARISGIRKTTLDGIGSIETGRTAETTLQQALDDGQTLLCWDDPEYPARLRTIHDPPVLLYLKGSPQVVNSAGIAVVGARAASTYGLQMAERFSKDLASRGLTIISGLALGIDSTAHTGALAVKGTTVAVLGCGIDIVYPARNRKLFDKISETGAIVSEYPPGTPPDGFRFPARNRIISGLSLGVLVVEAAKRSGSLITAHLALEQGREVFAMPGRVDSGKSEGSHRLLQEGAKLVHSVTDILEELPTFSSA